MTWDPAKFAAFDFETSGTEAEYALQPWRRRQGRFWATSLVWAHAEDGHLHRFADDLGGTFADKLLGANVRVHGGLKPTKADMVRMLEWAIENGITLVGWNTVFDISVLLAYGLDDLVMKVRWLDGMLLWRHAFIEPEYDMDRGKRKSYGLKTCVAEVLPQYAGYADDVDFHDPRPEARRKLHAYNERDTLLTLWLAEHWYSRLSPTQLRAALIEARSLPLLAKANLEGMVVDTLAAGELDQKLANDAASMLQALAPHGVTEAVVRSPKQLGELIYDKWKLPVLKENTGKKTGKVSRATDKEVLHELAFIDPRAKQLREYREALNNRTKFAQAPIQSAAYNDDGRTHPLAIPFGTYSGRLTYSSKQGKGVAEVPIGFALHQEKRGADFRNILLPPPGYALLEADASGQEYRWMAIASADPVMLQMCMPGEDPHSFMGARIAARDYHDLMSQLHAGDKQAKDDRQLGKVGNLCLAAGTLVLTDRGPCSIEQVRCDDLVWDGRDFVSHGGVVCSGFKQVMTYNGVTATPEHEVLVDNDWVSIQDAASLGWAIEPAMGTGWARQCRAAVRVVDGLVRRAAAEVWRAVCRRALQVWHGSECQSSLHGDKQVASVQSMRRTGNARESREVHLRDSGRQEAAEARQRLVPTVPQSKQPVVSKLRRARDRMSVWLGARRSGVGQTEPATPDVLAAGYRPREQRWSLRAWKLALGHAEAEPCEPAKAWVYDITDCGPRSRFAANGRIVHNSLQYRTSARKLRTVARVQYGIPMTMPQAERIHSTYPATYRNVPLYWNSQIAQTKRLGYVETFAGRRVQVTGNWDGPRGWSMGSTAINYRIQGTGADQKYLALSVLRDYVTRRGIHFAWDLHDGIYWYVPEAIVDTAAREMKHLLDNLPYRKAWGFTPPIPMPWDVKTGFSWGTLKEWKGA